MAPVKEDGSSLVLADVPERVALRDLTRQLEARRDRIAELDLEIESVRETLVAFEGVYHARLADESQRLARIEGLVHHIERWVDLLATRPAATLGGRARRIDRRRQRDLGTGARTRRAPPRADEAPEEEEAPAEVAPAARSRADQLKAAYRALARRFHPDLARTEEERLRFGNTMARINELYRAGDLERLVTLAEQAKGGEIDNPDLPLPEQLRLLGERLAWFDAVLENLTEERASLDKSPTGELWRRVEYAKATGRDLVDELRGELRERADRAYTDVQGAVTLLEAQVAQYNRQSVGAKAPARRQRGTTALDRLFDPYADKRLVRFGLDKIKAGNASPAARELASWLETAEAPPHVLRLLLLAYVAELSPHPLAGLEKYEDLELRFRTLSAKDDKPISLAAALVEADDLVEYGVRRATDSVAHLGLRFRSAAARESVPVALAALPVRRVFKEVLAVLGEHAQCGGCRDEVFTVPLYRLRGLDDLRASVCPRCGHTQSSYWMPKGKDVQAVLNAAFVDFEIVSDWRFRLARGSIALQLVPCQVEALTVRDLKTRLYDDVFARNEIEVAKKEVELVQGKERLADKTPLAELEATSFTIRFTKSAELSEQEALELLKHRIRNRFRR